MRFKLANSMHMIRLRESGCFAKVGVTIDKNGVGHNEASARDRFDALVTAAIESSQFIQVTKYSHHVHADLGFRKLREERALRH